MITVAVLHKFIYEFRGNNTYIILDRTALFWSSPLYQKLVPISENKVVQMIIIVFLIQWFYVKVVAFITLPVISVNVTRGSKKNPAI